jgi:hypothetical protein
MKCIACGRDMLERGTHYECPNFLCDYEEEIENKEVLIRLQENLQSIVGDNISGSYSLHY